MNWFSFKGAVQLLTNVIDDETVDFNIRLAIAIVLARLPQPTVLQLNGEEWRDIRGYEGLYQVSNWARVRSFHYGRNNILKPYFQHGYLNYALAKNGVTKRFQAHRLVAEAFLPNPDNLPVVHHINGNRADNRIENLQWVTYSENTKRSYEDGRKKPNRPFKLTSEQYDYIRRNPDGLTRKQLAEKFKMHVATIYKVQKRSSQHGG